MTDQAGRDRITLARMAAYAASSTRALDTGHTDLSRHRPRTSSNALALTVLLDECGKVTKLLTDLDYTLDVVHAGVVHEEREGETPPVLRIDIAS